MSGKWCFDSWSDWWSWDATRIYQKDLVSMFENGAAGRAGSTSPLAFIPAMIFHFAFTLGQGYFMNRAFYLRSGTTLIPTLCLVPRERLGSPRPRPGLVPRGIFLRGITLTTTTMPRASWHMLCLVRGGGVYIVLYAAG